MAKKKPPKLRLIQGTPGHRPIPDKQPVTVAPRLPDPPAYLSPRALQEWNTVGPLLLDQGLITNLDAGAFANLCQTVARLEEAEEALAKEGLVRTSKRSKLANQSAYLRVINNSQKQLERLWDRFGMNPESRSTLGVASGAKRKTAFQAYLESGKDKAPC